MTALPPSPALGLPQPRAKPPLPLVRNFSLATLAGLGLLLPALIFNYRYLAFRSLEEQQTQSHVNLTQLFANTTWLRYSEFVHSARNVRATDLARRPEVARLLDELRSQMHGLNVVRIKLYDLTGLTVFSTDARQIGENRRDNPGFVSALAGTPKSMIVFREQFSSFEGDIADRDLITTYLPLRRDHSAPVEGVIEVYSDISPFVAKMRRTQWEIVGIVVTGLGLLYLMQMFLARRAEALIRQQAEDVRRANSERLEYESRHDRLTGLPNRLDFTERLDREVRLARRAKAPCAVLSLSLDRFKEVNDSFGHAAGDDVLRLTATRLVECLRESDLAARAEGPEFLVGLPGAGGLETITGVAEKIQQQVFGPGFPTAGQTLSLSASIGIAVHPADGSDAAALIQSAGAALHDVRRKTVASYEFHSPDMNRRVLELLQTERRLRQALEQGDFALHYQPQMDLESGRIVGVEALLRWHHAELGSIPPAQFIPVAEECRLIVPIGSWVLSEACRQHRAWIDAGLPPIAIAVNISPLQFSHNDVVREATYWARRYDLAPGALELEVTESTTMEGTEELMQSLHELRQAGIRLALDDFGTGYSSLNRLKRLPLDRLKIDQSFVRELPDSRGDSAIAAVIIEMGMALDLKVLAEGVENEAQLDFLRRRGCHEIQGYYFSQPLPADDLARFVRLQSAIASAAAAEH